MLCDSGPVRGRGVWITPRLAGALADPSAPDPVCHRFLDLQVGNWLFHLSSLVGVLRQHMVDETDEDFNLRCFCFAAVG